MTNGVPDRALLWPWRRAGHPARVRRRWAEAEQVAGRIGLESAGRQDAPTRSVKDRLAPTLARIEAAIDRLRPGVLWAPAYEGGHQDHDSANFLSSRLGGRVPLWEFAEYTFAGGRIGSQSFVDARGAETVIALTDEEQALKRSLLRAYAPEKDNLGYVQCEREAFRPLADYDYTRPPHPGKLFYERFQWVPFHPRVDRTRSSEVCAAFSRYLNAPEG